MPSPRRRSDDQVHLDFGQFIQSESGNWYRTLQRLGSGGSAVTYLMVGTNGVHNGNPVAVKFFRRVSKPHRRDEFLRETAFLRECDHPGVMRIFDKGTFLDSHPFIVAEYLPLTFADIINEDRSTTVERLSWAVQLLNTLVYLDHQKPAVIHRDIKPRNVFVKGRSCVLGDFGLLKRQTIERDSDDGRLKQSVGLGMPFRYRTPDLVDYACGRRQLTTKSDVFQLGLVLAELFTGKNPQIESKTPLAPVKLRRLGKVLGSHEAPIRSLVASMLEIDADRRRAADELLVAWQAVFMEAAANARAQTGKVF